MRIAGAIRSYLRLFDATTKICLNDINFVIDVGASITILLHKMAHSVKLNTTPMKLSAANGKDIECFDEVVVDILDLLDLCCSYIWIVIVADTFNPLIGEYFLHQYGLILDCSNGRLSDETTRHYI